MVRIQNLGAKDQAGREEARKEGKTERVLEETLPWDESPTFQTGLFVCLFVYLPHMRSYLELRYVK